MKVQSRSPEEGFVCADILQNIRSARNRMTTNPNYFHVYGHMDKYLNKEQLSFEQRLNKRCVILAKEAVDLAVKLRRQGHVRKESQLLPKESAAVLVKGVKVTGDIADALRYAKGYEEARVFLVNEKGWPERQFDAVDWKSLHKTLKNKADAYCTWLSKQHSRFCGTGVMCRYYSGDAEADVGCPNCGCVEDNKHLCVCMDEDRTRLFSKMTEKLSAWLNKSGKTDPELAYWIPKYTLARGTITFQDMGNMSPSVKRLAEEQDAIGWRNFMEGRLSSRFCEIQSVYLTDVECHLNGRDWMKSFISRLMQLTHSQWLYRNITLHDKAGGSLRKQKMEQMKSEAEMLACTDPCAFPKESRFLLELDDERYIRGDGNFHDKSYWLIAMKAAVVAGRRKARGVRRRTRTDRERNRSRVATLAATQARVTREVRKDLADMGQFPFRVSEAFQQGRKVVGEAARMAERRSNRRYKPGD